MSIEYFCGECGNYCTIVEQRGKLVTHAHGACKVVSELTLTSDCCGSEELFTDPELTNELSEHELELTR